MFDISMRRYGTTLITTVALNPPTINIPCRLYAPLIHQYQVLDIEIISTFDSRQSIIDTTAIGPQSTALKLFTVQSVDQ